MIYYQEFREIERAIGSMRSKIGGLELREIERAIASTKAEMLEMKERDFSLVNGLFEMWKKHRELKNYEISDEIRDILDRSGFELIQKGSPTTYSGYWKVPIRIEPGEAGWRIKDRKE